jgi:cytoskeletal protein CcmA (bactofilin family)
MLEIKSKPISHSATAATPARAATTHNTSPQLRAVPTSPESRDFQPKLSAITGEVQFKGTMSVDGLINGSLGSQGGTTVKQRMSATFATEPELTGTFNFRDMIRINGHIAGAVLSKNGTIIVDVSAKVDARVEVAVAIIGGTVKGEIIAHERVELGPTSKIYGNIWTRSIVIKDGAIFEGVCRMIEDNKTS